jgi:hypothetical protein
MSLIPHEARDALMRAWLKVLSDRHPNVTWIPVPEAASTPNELQDKTTTTARI